MNIFKNNRNVQNVYEMHDVQDDVLVEDKN